MRYYLISGDIGRRFGMAFNRTEMPEFKLFVDYYLENEEQFQSVYLRSELLDFPKYFSPKNPHFFGFCPGTSTFALFLGSATSATSGWTS